MSKALVIIVVVVVVLASLLMLVSQQIDQYGKYHNKKLKHSLLDFHHFVATCDVTEPNMYVVGIRLRHERASRNMNNPEVCNKINEIALLYEERFRKLLQERDDEAITKTVYGEAGV